MGLSEDDSPGMGGKRAPQARIGTSGWNYRHWSGGVFYPPEMKQQAWLRYYSRFFDTVEVNNTFYRLPDKEVFQKWEQLTPPGFCFSLKVSRFYTHIKHLAQPEISMAAFLENASGMREKLGVFLFQLPPHWGYQPDRLSILLEYMSRQTVLPEARSAVELRDPTWYNPECLEMLRWHNVALVLADQPGFSAHGPLTADFVFVRRHGPGAMYASQYSEEALQADARTIRGWQEEGRDVWVYFNNDLAGYAVRNALRLKEILGIRLEGGFRDCG